MRAFSNPPLERWWKFFAPLFGIQTIVAMVIVSVAVLLGICAVLTKRVGDMNVDSVINGLIPEIIALRRWFHQHPELGQKEFQTQDKICEILDGWGIEYIRGIAETGVVAIIRGLSEGRVIGIRADIDALPIQEESGLSFASVTPNVMHACGHDIHTSILLGTAKALFQLRDKLPGTVKLFFQPAEETIGGAERMIAAGCLENPHVDAVIGLHVNTDLLTGSIGLKYGTMFAGSDMITLRVFGKANSRCITSRWRRSYCD